MLIRHVATVAAIAALLGPVSLAQAQSDNERQEMLRGGATKKGIYNIFGLDGTGLGRTTVRYDSKYAPGTIVINTAERRLYLVLLIILAVALAIVAVVLADFLPREMP